MITLKHFLLDKFLVLVFLLTILKYYTQYKYNTKDIS